MFSPKELLPKIFPNVRIFSFGYDVDINHFFGSAGQTNVFRHSQDLLNDVSNISAPEGKVRANLGGLERIIDKTKRRKAGAPFDFHCPQSRRNSGQRRKSPILCSYILKTKDQLTPPKALTSSSTAKTHLKDVLPRTRCHVSRHAAQGFVNCRTSNDRPKGTKGSLETP